MSNKEFFLKTLKGEMPRFEAVLKAVPQDHMDYRPDDKSRTAKDMLAVFPAEMNMLVTVAKTGSVDMSAEHNMPAFTNGEESAKAFSDAGSQLIDVVSAMSDEQWETGTAEMIGVNWKDAMYGMAWGFLFDLVHHRGQLSAYLRAMGGKVPSIYGPSADSQM
jgi:hypothetical protein